MQVQQSFPLSVHSVFYQQLHNFVSNKEEKERSGKKVQTAWFLCTLCWFWHEAVTGVTDAIHSFEATVAVGAVSEMSIATKLVHSSRKCLKETNDVHIPKHIEERNRNQNGPMKALVILSLPLKSVVSLWLHRFCKGCDEQNPTE